MNDALKSNSRLEMWTSDSVDAKNVDCESVDADVLK